jgi:hypothetical protein
MIDLHLDPRTARRLLATLTLALFATAIWGASTAAALVKCKAENSTMTVELTGADESASIGPKSGMKSGEIFVGSSSAVICSGFTPTFANVDFVNVIDAAPRGQVSIVASDVFVSNGIEIIVAMNGAEDQFGVFGFNNRAENVVVGSSGIDLDGNGTKDVTFLFGDPASVKIEGGPFADVLSASGSLATGGKPFPNRVVLAGFGGNDTLVGAEAGDSLSGGEGDDTILAGGGDDQIIADFGTPGNDEIFGGAGSDTMSMPTNETPVRVDLADTKAQETGEGKDTITGVENVVGSPNAPNTLLGNESPNRLVGGEKDDVFDGRGGDDTFEGRGGQDLVTYRDAEGSVDVNLVEGEATGDAGKDRVLEIENVTGSPFDDLLIGDDGPNLIEPLGGADKVQALGGDDTIRARDGAKDDVSCGAGNDSAVVDGGLDTVRPDCERVDPPPAAAAGGGGNGAGGGGGSGAKGGPAKTVALKVGGAKAQRLAAKRALVITVRCPQEACTVAATASGALPAVGATPKAMLKLKKATKKLAAAKAQKLTLRIGRKQAAAIAERLGAGKRVSLKIAVTATDAAGAKGVGSLRVAAKP